MDRGAWWATGHGVTESDMTEWLTYMCTNYYFKKFPTDSNYFLLCLCLCKRVPLGFLLEARVVGRVSCWDAERLYALLQTQGSLIRGEDPELGVDWGDKWLRNGFLKMYKFYPRHVNISPGVNHCSVIGMPNSHWTLVFTKTSPLAFNPVVNKVMLMLHFHYTTLSMALKIKSDREHEKLCIQEFPL